MLKLLSRMNVSNATELIALYARQQKAAEIINNLKERLYKRLWIKGLSGSSLSLLTACIFRESGMPQFCIFSQREDAAYFYNDLVNLFEEQELGFEKERIKFFPSSYRKNEYNTFDSGNMLLRTAVIRKLSAQKRDLVIVTYPEAMSEKVVTRQYLQNNILNLNKEEIVNIEFIAEVFAEYGFERVEFVAEPGQFTIRGGIIDVFSYGNDYPYRIEFTGDSISSLRTFDPASQLSIERLAEISVIPNLEQRARTETMESLAGLLPSDTVIWIENAEDTADIIEKNIEKVKTGIESSTDLAERFSDGKDFLDCIRDYVVIETGKRSFFVDGESNSGAIYEFDIKPQASFNKKFELLIEDLHNNTERGFHNIILSDTAKQTERINTIINDIASGEKNKIMPDYHILNLCLHEGFIDRDSKLAIYTDHQLFERFHRYRLRDALPGREAINVKELYGLKPGDYVTHIDHGIGRFGGLEKIEVNGRQQEAIRLVYKDGDILYISIHSLHRIAKYVGKEGTEPMLHRLGSNAWNNLKNKTKQKVKDIARDLIKLYASRKASEGFSFSADNYLQTELEASFIYEDTPDQLKSTADVKKDMEADYPMDRLICGDVGFGKTEVAIRAAFKAVSDSKQVALLVPTTVLALQHYKTFSERLSGMPCRVEYISRFRSTKTLHRIEKELEEGRVDILIGTHKLLGKGVKFKDLGLLIIDEEQKFGVSAKEKLKQMKVNVDTLTLTATPIPRTLQFSLMGARDLSVINTAPPNRFPIQTELHVFNEDVIKDAINYEISRGGQVFFLHNRVQNIQEIADMVKKLCPDVNIAIGHGQMKGHQLEEVMLGFIEGDYDVLVATTIIENGLDIPNANTIIINEAHHYGLSDLHQLRGRVGRSNRKAFCYLLSPPVSVLTDEARKRLRSIEEFTDLGSGFNIAMRDLDIRGAGNILGAEQSGFISEIGFETYQKILNEALDELREIENKELYEKEDLQTGKDMPSISYVRDCIIETDLSILIPDSYVSDISERLNLYKELDSIESETMLKSFTGRLIDRFGELPEEVAELTDAIRLRWIAKSMGFEKIVMKNGKFKGYFITNHASPYYQSESFSKVLEFVKCNPHNCMFRQSNDKLTLSFEKIQNIKEAMIMLGKIKYNE